MAITLAEFEKRIGRINAPAKVARIMRPAAIETALDAEGRAKLRVSGQTLNVRTGRLQQSIAGVARVPGGGTVEVVLRAGGRVGGKPVPYAATHERGATIRPKRAKMLRIPLPPALTAAGVDRMATPLRATAPGQFFIREFPDGRLYLMHTETGQPWYLLAREARIPARPYLRPSLDEAGNLLPDRVLARVRLALQGDEGAPA